MNLGDRKTPKPAKAKMAAQDWSTERAEMSVSSLTECAPV